MKTVEQYEIKPTEHQKLKEKFIIL
jgi:hypothetical protein